MPSLHPIVISINSLYADIGKKHLNCFVISNNLLYLCFVILRFDLHVYAIISLCYAKAL